MISGRSIELAGEMAATETNPHRRAFVKELPEGFGLIDVGGQLESPMGGQ
ncbi:hypothetical protein [Streptomyces sp. NPDC054797]